MEAYDFVHLAILALGGEIQGKTKLQKTVYFLGVLTGRLGKLGYRPHFYGPYSDYVAEAVERLKALSFIDQDVRGGSAIDRCGFEVCRYDYRLNGDGRSVADQKRASNRDLWRCMQEAVKTLRAAGDLKYMKLSVAAKAHFLLDKAPGAVVTEDELGRQASRFGWRVTREEIHEAAQFLQRLGLVRCQGPNAADD